MVSVYIVTSADDAVCQGIAVEHSELYLARKWQEGDAMDADGIMDTLHAVVGDDHDELLLMIAGRGCTLDALQKHFGGDIQLTEIGAL